MNTSYKEVREHLACFFGEFGFPEEAGEELLAVYDKITADKACADAVFSAVAEYQSKDYDFILNLEKVKVAFERAGIISFQGELIFIVLLARRLRELYAKEGIPDEVYKNTMLDCRYKLIECKCVEGIWGTFVSSWYKGFFNMTRFGLGRLQYDMSTIKTDYKGQGVELTSDSKILSVHIPRSEERLDKELVVDSYRRAIEFFADYFKDEPTVFVCNSWLLYTENKKILNPDSNIYKFISDYEVIHTKDYSSYKEMWRLFDVKITDDVDSLPRDSSLRRAYADRMKRGEPLGCSFGVYVPNDLK